MAGVEEFMYSKSMDSALNLDVWRLQRLTWLCSGDDVMWDLFQQYICYLCVCVQGKSSCVFELQMMVRGKVAREPVTSMTDMLVGFPWSSIQ